MEMINEDINLNNINNIYDAFSRHGIEYAEQYNQHAESVKLSSGNVESVGNSSDSSNDSNISEKEFKKRMEDFFASFISNDTLKYIVELFNNYKGSDLDKKYVALKNSYDSIKDAIDRDKQIRNNKNIDANEEKKIRNEIANTIRKSILNISSGDYTNRKSIHNSKKFDEFFKNNYEELNNNNNLLKYLTDEEWNKFRNTLEYSYITDDSNNNNSYNEGITNRIIEITDKVTFDSKVPDSISNFLKSVRDEISNKLVMKTYTFYDFGKRRLNMFDTNLKKIYLDTVKNDKSNYLNIRFFDIYRTFPEEEFWKNVSVFSCYNSNAYNNIISQIFEMNRRSELDINSTGNLTTNLSTRTVFFMIKRRNDETDMESKLKNRSNDPLFDMNLTPGDMKIIGSINRYYFIMVTEGYFKIGNMLNKASNAGKRLFKGIMNYNSI